MSAASNPEEYIEQQLEKQAEVNKEQTRTQAEINQAGNPDLMNQLRDERFLEAVTDPDVSSDNLDDDVEQEASAMLSRIHMLANFTPEEVDKRKHEIENKVAKLKAEHPSDRGPGSKCSGEVRSIMLSSEQGEKGTLTPSLARRYDETGSVRRAMETLGRNGKAWDGLTKIQSAVESLNGANEDSGGSTLSRAASMLPGVGS